MEEKTILKSAASVFTEEHFEFPVNVHPISFKDKFLSLIGMFKKKRMFVIKPATLGTMARISAEYLNIDYKQMSEREYEEKFLQNAIDLASNHALNMAKILALAVKNDIELPTEKEINFFMYNLTAKELKEYIFKAVEQLDLAPFMHSIISIQKIQILEQMNPVDHGS